jgi:hypothetical protein
MYSLIGSVKLNGPTASTPSAISAPCSPGSLINRIAELLLSSSTENSPLLGA